MTYKVTPHAPRAEIRATLRLALPIALAQAASIAVPAVDAVAMGVLGSRELAGGGLAAGILATSTLLAGGVVAAASPLIAAARARGDERQQRALASAAALLAIVLGATIALTLALSSGTILVRLGTPPEALPAATTYLRFASVSSIPALLASAFRHAHNASGRARRVAIASAMLLAAKVLFNVVLVRQAPELGVVGIGVSSVVGHSLAAALLFAWLPSPRGRLPRMDAVRAILRLGAPIGLMAALEVGLFAVSAVPMAEFGVGALAAHEIALQSVYLGFVIPLGIAQATCIRVAAAAGIDNGPGAQAAARAGFATVAVAAAVWAGGLLVLAPSLGTLLSAIAPAALLVRLVRLAALVHVLDALQAVLGFALRGLGDTRVPAVITALCYAVVAPVTGILLIAARVGPQAVWIALALGLGTTVVGFGIRWRISIARRMG